jgi:hypothetical protein
MSPNLSGRRAPLLAFTSFGMGFPVNLVPLSWADFFNEIEGVVG